jgi:hypothetical protein
MSKTTRIIALSAFTIIYWCLALYRLSVAAFSSTGIWPNQWGNSFFGAGLEAAGFIAIYIGLMLVMARKKG